MYIVDHFQSLLSDEQIVNSPMLILGNKIDKAGAASEDEIRQIFGLTTVTTGKVGFWEILGPIGFYEVGLETDLWAAQRYNMQGRSSQIFGQ